VWAYKIIEIMLIRELDSAINTSDHPLAFCSPNFFAEYSPEILPYLLYSAKFFFFLHNYRRRKRQPKQEHAQHSYNYNMLSIHINIVKLMSTRAQIPLEHTG